MAVFSLFVNGIRREADAEPDTPLLWILRDQLGLTGTKFGCGIGVCGACTVHRGRQAVRSCQVPATAAQGQSFTTIEGLGAAQPHPCQRAWLEEDVAQCGYCQPGMIMATAALLEQNPAPSDEQIDGALSELLCRCGTYPRIRKAVQRAILMAREAGVR